MFEKLLGLKSDYKSASASKNNFADLRFFSKLAKTDSKSIYDIARSLKDCSNPDIKKFKIHEIRNYINSASIADLINHMKSPYDIIRSLSAQAFAECGSPNILGCIEKMLDDENENLRLACMDAILQLESPDTLEVLRKAIKDNSARVRLKAAVCLAELYRLSLSKEAINVLNSALDDSDEEVREFVIDELGLIGNENSLIKILDAIDKTEGKEQDLLNESLELIMSRAMA
jgi:HEAT repeat protein